MRLLDPRFQYTPAVETDIRETWRKHGYRPTTEAERRARQPHAREDQNDNVSNIETRRRAKGE